MTWPRRPLEDVADFCLGKMLDQKKNRGELRPYLANVNVRWGGFQLDDLREMRFEDNEDERYGLKYGDIVMCEGGEPGRCAIWKDELPGMMVQKALHRLRPRKSVDHRFLYYSFLKKGRANELAGLFTGATIKHLPREKLAKVTVEVPPLAIQTRIADILSTYDDLIENNKRRIALLEESARLLYREWFVHLRFPGHEHVKVVDGVPQGWERRTLSEVAENHDRLRVPLSVMEREKRTGPYPYYGAASILDHVDEYIFDGRYLLMGEDGTVITARGAPMLQLVEGQFWVNNHAHVLSGTTLSVEALFCALSEYRIQGHITGVAQPKITQQSMNRIPIVIAPEVLRQEFQDVVVSAFDQRFTLDRLNRKLIAARDLLLPRLMSGKIAV